MNNATLKTQLEGLYHHFDKNLTPFIMDGDTNPCLRKKVEAIHDLIAEAYLSTINNQPVVKIVNTTLITPEITHAKFNTAN